MQEMREIWVQSLGWDDFLEKEMVNHFSILAWEISQPEEPGRLQSMGSESQIQLSTHAHMHTHTNTRIHTHTHTHIFQKSTVKAMVTELVTRRVRS